MFWPIGVTARPFEQAVIEEFGKQTNCEQGLRFEAGNHMSFFQMGRKTNTRFGNGPFVFGRIYKSSFAVTKYMLLFV